MKENSGLEEIGKALGELTLRMSLNLLATVRGVLESSKDDKVSGEIWRKFHADPASFYQETFYLSLFIVDWWLYNQEEWHEKRDEMMDHVFLFCHRFSATPTTEITQHANLIVWLESPEYQKSIVEFVEAMKHEDPNNLGPLYWINKRALMRILRVGEEAVKMHLPANIALQETEIAGIGCIKECLEKFRQSRKPLWKRLFGR